MEGADTIPALTFARAHAAAMHLAVAVAATASAATAIVTATAANAAIASATADTAANFANVASAVVVLALVSHVDVARRGVARWRAFVAGRRACPLLHLLEKYPDLFTKEVLERLNPRSLTLFAQVGKACRAAVVASGLPRLPTGVTGRLQLRLFCTSVVRLAWAKANGCPWGVAVCFHAAKVRRCV
jgi:hypothetical protein